MDPVAKRSAAIVRLEPLQTVPVPAPTGPVRCPQSATANATARTGFAIALLTMAGLAGIGWPVHLKVIAVVGATAMAMIAVDFGRFRTFRNADSGLAPAAVNAWSANRIIRKLAGLAVTCGVLAAIYAILPEYAGDFYAPARGIALTCLPWLLVATPFYVILIDRRQRDPEDAYAQLGALLTGQAASPDWGVLGQHARGWLVKGFFLPLMVVYLSRNLEQFWQVDFGAAVSSFERFYGFSYNTIFIFDLLFAVVGYTFTLRLLDNHIRSAEPTMSGWVVCIVCYQPFWNLISGSYLKYESDGYYWGALTWGHPAIYVAWGSAILACLCVYAWATVSFGLRFSNLTHRGIVTSGPYRWCKHPAYAAKCLSFWMISIPFLSNAGPAASLTQTMLLLGANALYVARAITEERHLARDPVYRDYQAYIREHGIVACSLRLVRTFRHAGNKKPAA